MADEAPGRVIGLIPYLSVRGAAKAADFYKAAFGATEVTRQAAQDGERLIHCHLKVNGYDLMLADEFPEQGHGPYTPQGVTLHLSVEDPRQWEKNSVAAGATVTMPFAVQFWGDYYGQIRDPFGHHWSIGGPDKA